MAEARDIPIFEALTEGYAQRFATLRGRVLAPKDRLRMRLGLAASHDRVVDLLRNPHKPPRDPYTCIQEYDPYADEIDE